TTLQAPLLKEKKSV
ncbi:hypothetical protein Tco_1373792, partial [Tanacetum coccineum]